MASFPGGFRLQYAKGRRVKAAYVIIRELVSLVPGAEEERLVHTDALPVN